MKHCSIDDCEYPNFARSLCKMHYDYWYRGKLKVDLPPPMSKAEAGRMGGKVGTTGGFYANRELASIAGAEGGRISRRKKSA